MGEFRLSEPRASGSCVVYVENNRRIEKVEGRLFEREEAVLHVMG